MSKEKCECDSLELFRWGCHCGFVNKEKAEKQKKVIMDIKDEENN